MRAARVNVAYFGKPGSYSHEVALRRFSKSAALTPRRAAPSLRSAPGGFAPGKVSVANVLTVGSRSTAGKTYYQYEILTRTADGDEGGRHHLFSTTVSNGKLYIMKLQAGDKRWFKGLERELKKVQESFSVL